MAMTAAHQRASRCTICRHPARQRIDQALASGVSLRTIARQEGVSKSVLGRHRDHGRDRPVSHLRTAISGTADPPHQPGQTPRSVQFELLSLDTMGQDLALIRIDDTHRLLSPEAHEEDLVSLTVVLLQEGALWRYQIPCLPVWRYVPACTGLMLASSKKVAEKFPCKRV